MAHWNTPPRPRDQIVLFASRLQDAIGPDHPVRLFEAIVQKMDFSAWEARYNLKIGQPPIHPRILAAAIVYGLQCGVRSSRALEEACLNRLDFMWLVEGRDIDHATFNGFRTRFHELLADLLTSTVLIGRELGLVDVSRVLCDGTKTRANNSRYQVRTQAQLDKQRQQLREQMDQLLLKIQQEDQREDGLFGPQGSNARLQAELADLQQRQQKLEAAIQKVQELDRRRQARREKNTRAAAIPTTDSDARVLPNKEGGHAPNYTPLATVEAGSGLVVDAQVLIGHDEQAALTDCVQRVQQSVGTVLEVVADAGFDCGTVLQGLQAQGVSALIPARQRFADNPAPRPDASVPVAQEQWPKLPVNPQRKKLDKAAFVFEAAQDRYWCPMGRVLGFVGLERYMHKDKKGQYRVYQSVDCEGCPLADRCLGGKSRLRRVCRDEYEGLREQAAQRMATEEAKAAMGQRFALMEGAFGIVKGVMGLRQFLLRGIQKVQAEWRWTATAFNTRKLLCALRRRPELAAKLA